MNTLNIELGGTPRDRRPEYDIIDDKNLKDLHTKRSGITRCGMLVLLLSCTSFMLIGTAIGTQVKYLYNLGYLKAKADPFVYQTRFLVVGDWGTSSTTASSEQDLDLGARGTQKEVAQEMGYVGEVFQPDFVVSTGDNMFPSGLRSTQDPLFNETFTDVYLEYPSLQVDWFSVLGEKDYGKGNNNANGLDETSPLYQSTSLSANHLDSHWECCGGRDFIVKQYTHLDIFFLDTSPFLHKYYNKPWAAFQGGISSQKTKTQAQLILLEQQLEQSRAPWKVVVGHHPIKSNGLNGDVPELQSLRFLLDKYKVNLYLNGHDLALQDIEEDRHGWLVHYVTSGAGARVQDEKRGMCCNEGVNYFSAQPGFVSVAVSRAELRVQIWGPKAMLLHEFTLSKHREAEQSQG